MDVLTRNWWALALRGLAAVLFGLVTLVAPHRTLAVLIALFGAYALLDGVFGIVAAVRLRREIANEWLIGLASIASVVCGVLLLGLALRVRGRQSGVMGTR